MKYLSYSLVVLLLFFLTCCQSKSKSVKLAVTSPYEDSEVYIDEEFVGTTDLEIMVTPGEHRITVVRRNANKYVYDKTFTFTEETTKLIKANDFTFSRGSERKAILAGRLKAVKIGDQIWAAKNLNLAVGDSDCYNDDPKNCEKYGRLYTYKAAMKAADLVPGWHLRQTRSGRK